MDENWKRGIRISWYLLGPLLLYALVYDLSALAWTDQGGIFTPYMGTVPEYVPAGMAGALVLGVWFYKERPAFPQKRMSCIRWFGLPFAAMLSCIFFNHLLVLLGIPSEGYDEVKYTLFGSSRIWQFLGPGCLIPLAEELVFRGLGYGRLRREMNMLPAAVITALLFGLYHGNLLQGVYACFMGILLALVYEAYGNLTAAWLFHAAANLTSIVLTNIP